MPSIKVPEEHVSGFSRIMRLSSDETDRVVAALEKAKSTNLRELMALVREVLPTLANEEAKEIVGTLLSLYSARTGMDMTVDSFVVELLRAAKRVEVSESQPSGALQDTLRHLLSVRPLSMISKARGLHTDHENIFCTARILTDLRAVFDADVKQDPVGFVMAHILHLGYHHAGKHTSLHIAMDKIDIDNLILALERAKAKAATLTTAVSGKSGFAILAE